MDNLRPGDDGNRGNPGFLDRFLRRIEDNMLTKAATAIVIIVASALINTGLFNADPGKVVNRFTADDIIPYAEQITTNREFTKHNHDEINALKNHLRVLVTQCTKCEFELDTLQKLHRSAQPNHMLKGE